MYQVLIVINENTISVTLLFRITSESVKIFKLLKSLINLLMGIKITKCLIVWHFKIQ